jgi:TetR/AcrR family fatty acid metabolism transcriptional regulator
MREEEMPRKKQEEKYNKILEAATRVFAREGFHNAKIEDVAKEAGVAHGTVYLYFGGKDDLLISIFQENLEELVEYVGSEVEKEANAEDKLRRMISLQIELIETNSELAELMLVEFPQTGKFLSNSVIHDLAAYIDMIANILKEGVAEGAFDDSIDVNVVATVIYSGIQGIATRWILEEMKYPLNKVANEISEVFLSGIQRSADTDSQPES